MRSGALLLEAPDLVEGPYVVRGKFSEAFLRAGHREPHAVASRPSETRIQEDLPAGHLHATLTQRSNEHARPRVVCGGVPVMAARSGRTHRHPVSDPRFLDVLPVLDGTGLAVDHRENILVYGLGEPQEGAVAPVQFPENPTLSDREVQRHSVHVDQDLLEGLRPYRASRQGRAAGTKRCGRRPRQGPTSSWCTGPHRTWRVPC